MLACIFLYPLLNQEKTSLRLEISFIRVWIRTSKHRSIRHSSGLKLKLVQNKMTAVNYKNNHSAQVSSWSPSKDFNSPTVTSSVSLNSFWTLFHEERDGIFKAVFPNSVLTLGTSIFNKILGTETMTAKTPVQICG